MHANKCFALGQRLPEQKPGNVCFGSKRTRTFLSAISMISRRDENGPLLTTRYVDFDAIALCGRNVLPWP